MGDEIMVKVQVVRRKNAAVLVQWRDGGGLRRATVPAAVVEGNVVAESVLEQGIPYGAPWAELVELSAQPADVERALYERGVWTADDLLSNPQAAVRALQAAYQVDASVLMRIARELGLTEKRAD